MLSLNWPFRPKIAYFGAFGPFPKMFDLGCYIPLESVIFFLFFEIKKNQKSQKKFFFFRLLYLKEIACADLSSHVRRLECFLGSLVGHRNGKNQ